MGAQGLDFQTVDVKFTEGLDTKNQKKLVLPGKWNQLSNLSLSEDGTPQRRDGVAALVGNANGNGLATFNKELLLVSGQTVSTVSTASTPDSVVAIPGELGYVSVAKDSIQRSTAVVDSLDCASGNGYTCYVWRQGVQPTIFTSIAFAIFDEATGAQVVAPQLISNAEVMTPRVVFDSDTFFIFWIDYTAYPPATLFCTTVLVSPTVTTPTLGPQVALISSNSMGTKNIDAVSGTPFATGQPLAVVSYPWNDGTTSVRTIGVTHSGGTASISKGPRNLIPEATASYASITSICCAIFNSGLVTPTKFGTFIQSTGASPMLGVVADTSWAVTAGPTLIDGAYTVRAGNSHIAAVSDSSAKLNLFYDQRGAQGNTLGLLPVRTVKVDAALVITGGSTLLNSASFRLNAAEASGPNGPWIGGKPFRNGASIFLPMYVQESYAMPNPRLNVNTNSEQCSWWLMDGLTGTVVAKALMGTQGVDGVMDDGAGVVGSKGATTPCSTTTLSAGVFSVATLEVSRLQFETTTTGTFIQSQTGVSRIKMTPNVTVAPIRSQLGQVTYFAGGVPSTYDGQAIVEQGFNLFPEGVSVVTVGSGGSMTAGQHQVVVIYEYVDGSGAIHQSAPSLPVTVLTVANDSLTVIVPTLLLTQKTGVNLVVFMTQAAGTIFNRVSTLALPNPNVKSAATLTITVTVADTTIAGAEVLYTQPDQAGFTFPNVSPGPMSSLAVHQNRLFFARSDQPGVFGFSQQYVAGVGLQFSPSLGNSVDVSAGPLVGWASMDEKLIIFCQRKPYVMYGSGPNGSGGFSTYGDPQEVSSDVGCSDARSILKMPNGVIFKSSKGWYMLGRDLVARYIGEGVEAYNANAVSAAVLLEDRQECRFPSSSGVHLIYDYLHDAWSTTTVTATATASNYFVADAIWWSTGNYYASVSLTQGLNQDTPGVFLDSPGLSSSAAIATTGRTSWLHPGVMSGFQRVRRFFITGTSPTQPTSSFVISVDYDDAYGGVAPGAYSFTTAMATAFAGFVVGRSVDLRSKLRRQKCKSIAFTFTDTPTTINPAGVNFQALSLQIGVKRGLNKLPAAQSVG